MKVKQLVFKWLCAFVAFVTFFFVACTNEDGYMILGSGRIVPVVTIEAPVHLPEPSLSQSTLPSVDDVSLKLTDLNDGYSASWTPWTNYDSSQNLNLSTYRVEAFYGDSTSEGYNAPWFYASETLTLNSYKEQSVELNCTLSNNIWHFNLSDAIKQRFSDFGIRLHTSHNTILINLNESKPLYLTPGKFAMGVDMNIDDRQLSFLAAEFSNSSKGSHNVVNIDLRQTEKGVDEIVISLDSQEHKEPIVWTLTEEFISAPQPEFTATGFVSGEKLSILEGQPYDNQLLAISSSAHLSSLLLTIRTTASSFRGLPSNIDLLNMTSDVAAKLQECGIEFSIDVDNAVVDFTQVPNHLVDLQSVESSFELVAVTRFGKISSPCTLNLEVLPVDIEVTSVDKALIGVDHSSFELVSPVNPQDYLRLEAEMPSGIHKSLAINSVTETESNHYRVDYTLPDGQESFTIKIYYSEQLKNRFYVERVSPKFALIVDAYALKAQIEIKPEDESLREVITSMLRVYSGAKELSVIHRDEDAGIITVAGLTSNTEYSFKGTLFTNPTSDDCFTEPVVVRTEKAMQIENSSFEARKNTITYDGLPSGGRYSQSIVPIFNQQNRVNVAVETPKQWATTNDKTFCLKAKNHNTWYMQPSVSIDRESYAGTFAVRINSVAWDDNGEAIPDYLQESQPFVNYSRNVPNIRHRAAGRLFLGTYLFKPSTGAEEYQEGVTIASRPTAISGFYKYLPCVAHPSDCGLVKVELLGSKDGQSVVIGDGKMKMYASTDYMAFSVPITYYYKGVKATKIKLMFASSDDIGTIDYESTHIVTHDDPITASSIGSSLWVDEITLTY